MNGKKSISSYQTCLKLFAQYCKYHLVQVSMNAFTMFWLVKSVNSFNLK